MANSVDPDQVPQNVASDLGLHCLLRPVCPSTHHGMYYGGVFWDFFIFLSPSKHVVGTHWKDLSNALLMSTHNIC